MLTTANLQSTRAIAAQEGLATRLRKDAEDPAFRERFGRFITETVVDGIAGVHTWVCSQELSR
jgi:hypothetical protein